MISGSSRRRPAHGLVAIVATATVGLLASAAMAVTVVGGITPSVRPAGLPTVGTFEKGDAWMAWARRGISTPYPASLGFLADQGAWYTPFIHRGMPGYYDIRGLQALPDTPPSASR